MTSKSLPVADKPLSSREAWLVIEQHTKEDLESWAKDASCAPNDPLCTRAAQLLQRAATAAAQLDQLEQEGIWTVTAGSDNYPKQLFDRLGYAAPALLHGVGKQELLYGSGVGVVGSRKITEEAMEVCRLVGRTAAKKSLTLITGGARGADREALFSALDAGGCGLVATADALRQDIRKPQIREHIIEQQLCLVTQYHPDAGWSVGAAMARNKIIYGLSQHVLVVASDKETGGTWSGATDALKHKWTNLAVWLGAGAGAGNQALVDAGGRGITDIEDLWTETTLTQSAPEQLTIGAN